jgi:hypothetical protein
MGCACSKGGVGPADELTPERKLLIKESWAKFQVKNKEAEPRIYTIYLFAV